MNLRDFQDDVSAKIARDVLKIKLEAELQEHLDDIADAREWNGMSPTGRRYESVWAGCGCCSDGGRCARYLAVAEELEELQS